MIARTTALLLLVALAGCQWAGRPDGADANHSASDGYYDAEGAPQATPLGGPYDGGQVIEPLNADEFGTYRGASAPAPAAAPAAPAEGDPGTDQPAGPSDPVGPPMN